jgi:hypothetical protein
MHGSRLLDSLQIPHVACLPKFSIAIIRLLLHVHLVMYARISITRLSAYSVADYVYGMYHYLWLFETAVLKDRRKGQNAN